MGTGSLKNPKVGGGSGAKHEMSRLSKFLRGEGVRIFRTKSK